MLPVGNGTTAFSGRAGLSSACAPVDAAVRAIASRSIERFGIMGTSD
jgi:hypothetical protein